MPSPALRAPLAANQRLTILLQILRRPSLPLSYSNHDRYWLPDMPENVPDYGVVMNFKLRPQAFPFPSLVA